MTQKRTNRKADQSENSISLEHISKKCGILKKILAWCSLAILFFGGGLPGLVESIIKRSFPVQLYEFLWSPTHSCENTSLGMEGPLHLYLTNVVFTRSRLISYLPFLQNSDLNPHFAVELIAGEDSNFSEVNVKPSESILLRKYETSGLIYLMRFSYRFVEDGNVQIEFKRATNGQLGEHECQLNVNYSY